MSKDSITTEWSERWEFESIARRPTGFGVAQMGLTHPTEGLIVVDLTREELRKMAMQALAAMEPDSGSTPQEEKS